MPHKAGARYIETVRLLMSREPAAELAAAANLALEDSTLEPRDAEFIVVAVESGQADRVVANVRRAAAGELGTLPDE